MSLHIPIFFNQHNRLGGAITVRKKLHASSHESNPNQFILLLQLKAGFNAHGKEHRFGDYKIDANN